MQKLIFGLCVTALAVSIAFAAPFVVAIPVMILWNWLMPGLFGFEAISYWQAFGLHILCSMLFKPSTSSSSK